jgi:XTP/dITP diphosphohydrolase
MKLYLASANPHKASEFQALSEASRGDLPGNARAAVIEVRSAAELGGMPAVVEDTGTFEGNALKKARALKALLPSEGWALADDSGLCVEALGGAPGVESAYFAGPEGNAASNLAKLVSVMRGVPQPGRSAEFVCVLALCGPAGLEKCFEGHCAGTLALEPLGAGGFGYDPLFRPEGFSATLAEMPSSAKNRISHRARAWALCVRWLAARG